MEALGETKEAIIRLVVTDLDPETTKAYIHNHSVCEYPASTVSFKQTATVDIMDVITAQEVSTNTFPQSSQYNQLRKQFFFFCFCFFSFKLLTNP